MAKIYETPEDFAREQLKHTIAASDHRTRYASMSALLNVTLIAWNGLSDTSTTLGKISRGLNWILGAATVVDVARIYNAYHDKKQAQATLAQLGPEQIALPVSLLAATPTRLGTTGPATHITINADSTQPERLQPAPAQEKTV